MLEPNTDIGNHVGKRSSVKQRIGLKVGTDWHTVKKTVAHTIHNAVKTVRMDRTCMRAPIFIVCEGGGVGPAVCKKIS